MLKYDLYTFANSNTMNGVTTDTRVVRVHPWWEKTLTGINWGSGILALLAFAWYLSSALRKKEQ
jgi:beta-glucosidase